MMIERPTQEFVAVTDRSFYEGRVLNDDFRLLSVLGKGGMGAVFRGEQISVGRHVAVKVFRPGPAVSDTMEARFFREAKVMSQFAHPNIVQMIDFGRTDDDILYIAMELIEGQSVASLVERGRLSPTLVSEVLRQTCLGLAEAHSHGVIHRDLKASNLVINIDRSGQLRVRILDFGIAYPRDQEVKITQTGLLCGTPAYLAPEQARSLPIDHRADLYSVGVAAFEMLTGSLPFDGDTMQIMFKHVQEPPPDLRQYSELPDKLVDLLDHMLQKQPDDRPADAVSIARAISAMGLRAPILTPGSDPFGPHILPRLDTTRAPRSARIQINTVMEGSTPFMEADASVKGAWAAFIDQASLRGEGSIDPNLEGLGVESSAGLDMVGYERPLPDTIRTSQNAFKDHVDGVTEFEVTDAILNAPMPRTGRVSALKPAQVEAYQPKSVYVASDAVPVPEKVRNLGDSVQVMGNSVPAYEPKPRAMRTQQLPPAQTKQVSLDDPNRLPAWSLWVAAGVFLLVVGMAVYAMQKRGFAPEGDSLRGEEWESYKKEKLELEILEESGRAEPTEAESPSPEVKPTKKKSAKPKARPKRPQKTKGTQIDLWDSKSKDDDPFELEN